MAIIKYVVKENNALGTHSFYAQAVSYSTLDFTDLAEEVVEGLGISPELVNTIMTRYMRVARRNVLRGHRVKFGDLLTIYPQITCSVKDELNEDGTVKKPVTLDMFSLAGAKGSIGATIAQPVQQSFASSVSWKRVTESVEGNADSTATDDNSSSSSDEPGTGDNPGGSGSSSSTSSSSSSSGDGNEGGSNVGSGGFETGN